MACPFPPPTAHRTSAVLAHFGLPSRPTLHGAVETRVLIVVCHPLRRRSFPQTRLAPPFQCRTFARRRQIPNTPIPPAFETQPHLGLPPWTQCSMVLFECLGNGDPTVLCHPPRCRSFPCTRLTCPFQCRTNASRRQIPNTPKRAPPNSQPSRQNDPPPPPVNKR